MWRRLVFWGGVYEKIFKDTFIAFSCIYTLITIVSSILQLILGKTSDTNFNLIHRGIVMCIPITSFFFIKELKYNDYIKLAIHYAVIVLITMLETYIVGVITQDLAPTAYRY